MGVGATQVMLGPDVLFEVMTDVVSTCLDKVGGVNVPLGINYLGTGSGAAGNRMTRYNPATQRMSVDSLAPDVAFPPVQAKTTLNPTFKSGLNNPTAYIIAAGDGSVVPARCPNGFFPTGSFKCLGPYTDVDKNGAAGNQLSNINNPANHAGGGLG